MGAVGAMFRYHWGAVGAAGVRGHVVTVMTKNSSDRLRISLHDTANLVDFVPSDHCAGCLIAVINTR